ncbi:hypothetical protein SPBRAN_492 [uncultured Candidatus Thioglobus sp.]|nr:hypothetical protein SPBRAN_492 [uncultured Candidatus Thioglobus sp.]
MKNITIIEQKTIDSALRKIAENVKHERKKQKISQLNLSMAMGYESVGLVSCIEAGLYNKRYNLIHLISIAKILDISILKLFEGVDEILQSKQ